MTDHETGSPGIGRALIAGLAGGVGWFASMLLFFGPAQALLANPEHQSDKFLHIVGEIEPLPYTTGSGWILPAGLLAIGLLYGVAYHFTRNAFGEKPWWGKGLRFGAVAWLLMVPWFEFYLPWNVMHEPILLVLLEMVLWMGVLLVVGLTTAGVYEWKLGENAP